MRIQHNIMAMNAYRNYNTNTSALSKNLEKLSSGYKINRAGDDAAGLAISEKMRAQITGLEAAQKNVKDGISLVKTAEGAMQEMQDMLNRMDYLATQSANGTYQDEVDREALQAEVDQLLTEIDRIADSANFNGIKLLDGTLGMNSSAFEVKNAAVQYTAAGDGQAIDLDAKLAAASAGSTSIHYTQPKTDATAPAFAVDLSSLKLNVSGTSTKTGITINIAGLGSFTASDVSATATAGAIASALASAIMGSASAVQLGSTGVWFTASAGADGKITFTFLGIGASGSAAASATDVSKLTPEMAEKVNALLGGAVTVEASASDITAVMPEDHHNVINVKLAVGQSDGQRAGIDLNMDSDIVADGNTLTIDGKTFTFKTKGSSSVVTATGSNVIDVSDYVTGSGAVGTEAIKAAIAQLSNKTTTNFQIQAGSGNVLHIDQASTSTKEYVTRDDLVKVFEAAGPAQEETMAATTIKLTDNSKISEGDTLQIGSKTYTFSKTAGTNVVKIGKDAAETLTNLKNAIGSTYNVELKDNVLTVSAKAKTDAAPEVLGKGLTLQIGDTSDSYNQLNVSIKDMHAAALGVGGLSISTAEDAAAAIQTIRNAINSVSSVRGTLGATQNRLEHTQNNLSVMAENIQDAESTIRDTDVAEEMMSYVKNNILVQSAQAMLAQANQVPQGVLQLLG